MPPRIRLPSARRLQRLSSSSSSSSSSNTRFTHLSPRCYASLATTPSAALPHDEGVIITHHNPTQPPSYKPAEFRKTQLHRAYTSLLRSSPLMLLFQHNNLKAVEWSGIRRELSSALRKVDAELAAAGDSAGAVAGESAKLQIIQTGIFASALKVVEFYNPETDGGATTLSRTAWETARRKNRELSTGLEPLLSGPLMVVSFPSVSPQHVRAVLEILSPSEGFKAPKRRVAPGLYEAPVQSGLQKLMLLGARVEGDVFDTEGTKWVGSIAGGIRGLRSQLVYMLQSVGAGVTTTLEGAAKSLYVTVESRRQDMEGPAEGESSSATAEGAEKKE
ncbi:hypothetical protein AAFC00_005494 [Neodothiora populina]|uniref:Uncharacterized protein n=1 Tax=Neodothiora populina TaxID=2781224 RepID=A0ABR3PL15_9PEZI